MFLGPIFKMDLIFYSSFRFTTKLKVQRVPIHPLATANTHTHMTSPPPTSPTSVVTVPEPTLAHHDHAESPVYIRVLSQCCTLYGQMYNAVYPPL